MTPAVAVLDANVLLRLADPTAPLRPVARAAVRHHALAGTTLVTVPQSAYEFWVVATRPVENNGLGLSVPECERELARLQTSFPVRNDAPGLFAEWRALVAAHDCKGKVAHDARYVAAMRTHGVAHILTFNGDDFRRFPGVVVLDPNAVPVSVPPPGGTP